MAKQDDIEGDFSGWAEIIWSDPGGTTGLTIMQVAPDALDHDDVKILESIHFWRHKEFTGSLNRQAGEVIDWMLEWCDAAIGTEDYLIGGTGSTSKDVISPIEINAKIEYGLYIAGDGRDLHKQMPVYAKKSATDDRLKRWGLYMDDGLEHGRDADRHAITFLRDAKKDPRVRMKAWPHLYDTDD